jgi:hypothetical protein
MRLRVSIGLMRRSAALALVLVVAGCGGHAKRTLTPAVSTQARGSQLHITITAPTHHPRAGAKWPVTIRAVNGYGQQVHGTVTMRIVFNGAPVGKVDNGRVYRFFGTWREKPGQEITWPKASRGQPLEFEAIVKAQHKTVKKTFAITVR